MRHCRAASRSWRSRPAAARQGPDPERERRAAAQRLRKRRPGGRSGRRRVHGHRSSVAEDRPRLRARSGPASTPACAPGWAKASPSCARGPGAVRAAASAGYRDKHDDEDRQRPRGPPRRRRSRRRHPGHDAHDRDAAGAHGRRRHGRAGHRRTRARRRTGRGRQQPRRADSPAVRKAPAGRVPATARRASK